MDTRSLVYYKKKLSVYNTKLENAVIAIFRASKNNKEITCPTIRSYVDTHVKGVGITKGNTHLFRHTFITRKCIESKDAFYIQQLAGHKDLSTTKKYYQCANSYIIAKVNLLPIEQLLASIKT